MKLLDILFCDDIRFETKNKFSLMGLYNDRMVYPPKVQWPIPARLAILLRFTLEEKENLPSYFEFKYYTKEKNIAEVKGTISTNSHDKFTQLIINADGLQLTQGDLGYEITLFDEQNNKIFHQRNDCALKIMTE